MRRVMCSSCALRRGRELDAPDDVPIPPAAFAQLADETSERWYAQFLAERG